MTFALIASGAFAAEVEVGKPAPEFQVAKTLDGKPARIEDFRGKVLLLDFWATWCGPCRSALPNVYDLYQKYHEKGFEILGISLDRDILKLKSFIAQYGLPWPQVCDGKVWDSAPADLYGVSAIPHTVLIDGKGVVRAIDPHGEELEGLVTGLLGVPRSAFSPHSIVSWSPEVPEASGEVTITYRPFEPEMKNAAEVFMEWGVNFWQVPEESLWPSGSVVNNERLSSPMKHEGDAWTITVALPGDASEIDLYFRGLNLEE